MQVLLGAISLAGRSLKNPLTFLFAVGFLTVFFDVIMEPTAIKLDYWQWQTDFIPIQNYFVWFFISIISAGFYWMLHFNLQSRLAYRYMLIQMAFFIVLDVFLR